MGLAAETSASVPAFSSKGAKDNGINEFARFHVLEMASELHGSSFDNADAPAGLFELHNTVLQGEKRVIAAYTDVPARPQFRAALAHDNASGCHGPAVRAFYSQSFGVTVAIVSARAASFFGCHG
jgi:hypothetical protein